MVPDLLVVLLWNGTLTYPHPPPHHQAEGVCLSSGPVPEGGVYPPLAQAAAAAQRVCVCGVYMYRYRAYPSPPSRPSLHLIALCVRWQ
jgi:hypothetical protein